MKIRRFNSDEYHELMWPEVSLRATDFRNTFPGDLVNVASVVTPEANADATLAMLEQRTRKIAKWIISHRRQFSAGDRFQIILGWPKSVRETGRQVIKMGGEFDAVGAIADGTANIVPMPGWSNTVFEKEDTEQRNAPLPRAPQAGHSEGGC
jgi:hypothetical protein